MKALIVVLSCCISACAAQVSSTRLGTMSDFAPTPDSVNIPIYATTVPTCAYDEVASISAEIAMTRGADERVTESLRQRARALGGQTIIAYRQDTRDLVVSRGQAVTELRRNGIAIRFRSQDCQH